MEKVEEITSNVRQFGLIGYPLSHSFSPQYFANKFEKENIKNTVYHARPLENIQEVKALFLDYAGLNVTIPYKEQVIPLLDEIEEAAKTIGAVNTIKIQNGKTKGYNTDVYGFEESLKPFLKKHHKKALVFGTGGASKAICYVLKKLNIDFRLVSRTPSENQWAYKDINKDIANEYKLLINTTPLGMSPNYNQCVPFPYKEIGEKHLLYDLVYNPEKSLFLQKGALQEATIKNGLEMLHLQAEKSWEIWNRRLNSE